MKYRTLSLYIGGTNIRAAVVDRQGTILQRDSTPTLAHQGRDAVLRRIVDLTAGVSAAEVTSSLAGIGVSQAGPTEPGTGVLYNAPNLPGWSGFTLKPVLEERFSLATTVANDANAAAVGVHRYGRGRGSTNMIYITVSTGVGGGVIIDGRLYAGSRGFAGEIGHMTIDLNGPQCVGRNRGCLEALSSGTAVARMARERLSDGRPSVLRELAAGDMDAISARMVAEAAHSGDDTARDIFAEVSSNLGVGIVGLIHAFDPDLIVIGGGMAQEFELLLPGVTREIRQRALGKHQDRTPVVKSELGDDAGLLGAASLSFEAADADGEG